MTRVAIDEEWDACRKLAKDILANNKVIGGPTVEAAVDKAYPHLDEHVRGRLIMGTLRRIVGS
jgi:hypothetical protein